MQPDNVVRLRVAAEKRRRETAERARKALEHLASTGDAVSVARLAELAQVSRSWIYTQPALLEEIEAILDRSRQVSTDRPDSQRASTASLLRRLELVHEQIAELKAENRQLREQLARAYGAQRTDAN